MRFWVLMAMLLPLFFACDKKEQSDVAVPLTASMRVEGDQVQLVLATAEMFPQTGYVIYHRESSKGDKQCINLKYVYQRSDVGLHVMSPAIATIYATAEPEQKFQIKYKGKSADLVIRYDGVNYSIESDNTSFVQP